MLDKIKDLSLEDLVEFRDHGDMTNAPSEVLQYALELEKVHGMHLRIKDYGSRDAIINHLVKFNGYSNYLAAKLHDEMLEYFYGDRTISKNAHRYRLADLMEKGINTALVLAKDAKEVIAAIKEIKSVAQVLQLDQTDGREFPVELLAKPVKLYTSNAEALGMMPMDRYKLGTFIDELEGLTEPQKIMAKRDSMLLPVKFFQDDRPRE
jgi:hypothetical protein